jgi:predicted MPP superfamily phosphohydrolase
MSLFFIGFFLAYGGMHVYAYLRAKSALHFGLFPGLAVAGVMLAMVFAPLLIRQAEKQGLEQLARVLSFAGYTWLGILFLFFSSSLVLDGYRLIVRIAEIAARADYRSLIPSANISFYLPLFVSVLIAGYGYYEAKEVRAERVAIKTDRITESIGKLRIVQISDVHLGLIIRQERLKRILRLVKEADPDILVSTGDLVDGQINGLPGLAEMFNEINPRYGKYAITGNHEYYAGLDQALAFTRNAGFVVLRGEGVSAGNVITIVGVDDPAGRSLGLTKNVSEKDLLEGHAGDRFVLFLKHRPLVDRAVAGLFDLQLSGHVHKGQIFPFSILTRLYYPVESGLAAITGGGNLYVSRGAGTWGPPIRFLAPPEIAVFDLVHDAPHEE